LGKAGQKKKKLRSGLQKNGFVGKGASAAGDGVRALHDGRREKGGGGRGKEKSSPAAIVPSKRDGSVWGTDRQRDERPLGDGGLGSASTENLGRAERPAGPKHRVVRHPSRRRETGRPYYERGFSGTCRRPATQKKKRRRTLKPLGTPEQLEWGQLLAGDHRYSPRGARVRTRAKGGNDAIPFGGIIKAF